MRTFVMRWGFSGSAEAALGVLLAMAVASAVFV